MLFYFRSESEMSDVCITPWIVNFCENYVGHEWYVEVRQPTSR